MLGYAEIKALHTQNKVKKSAKRILQLMSDTKMASNVFVQKTVKMVFSTIPLGF